MNQPTIAQKAPYPVAVEAGKTYYWCACGQSKTQPLCDGSHKGSAFSPTPFKAEKTARLFLRLQAQRPRRAVRRQSQQVLTVLRRSGFPNAMPIDARVPRAQGAWLCGENFGGAGAGEGNRTLVASLEN